MVGIVIVSHSKDVAKGVYDLSKMMASTAPVAFAGGMSDGGLGTDFEQIMSAVEEVLSSEGVIVFVDMGSSLMTTEIVIEALEGQDIRLADCPLVEGAISASVSSMIGKTIDEIMLSLAEPDAFKKIF